jgi:hypothetical protein
MGYARAGTAGPVPSRRRMLFTAVHDSMSVPSTLKMLARQQMRLLGLAYHATQQLARHLRLNQPVTVLGEDRVIPDRLVNRQPQKPAKQEVIEEVPAFARIVCLQWRYLPRLLRCGPLRDPVLPLQQHLVCPVGRKRGF